MWRVHISVDFDTEEEASKAQGDMEEAAGKNNGDVQLTEIEDLESGNG